MKKKILFLFTGLIMTFLIHGKAEAALPTFDAVNATLNQLRNALIQSQFIEEMSLAFERLKQLRATYTELIRFHSGLDEILESFVGDPIREIRRRGESLLRGLSPSGGANMPQIEFFTNAKNFEDIREAYENITGKLPDSGARPYIPFEEFQVIEGFEMAKAIREQGEKTRRASELIKEQAKSVSPKGAARLSAQAQAHMIDLGQENQEALGKLIELEAAQLGQVTREEKRLETERIRYMDDAGLFLDSLTKGERV